MQPGAAAAHIAAGVETHCRVSGLPDNGHVLSHTDATDAGRQKVLRRQSRKVRAWTMQACKHDTI